MILLASLFPIGHIKEDESIHTKLIRVRAGSSGRSLTLEGGITVSWVARSGLVLHQKQFYNLEMVLSTHTHTNTAHGINL